MMVERKFSVSVVFDTANEPDVDGVRNGDGFQHVRLKT
jgi:hypothetical protein